LNKDLQPYVCLFPECAEALVFFTDQKEWISHMEASHSTDWPRKVHNITWYCDADHEPVKQFQSELEWRTHMQDPHAHPNRQSKPPTDVQLAALSTRKQQRVIRDQHVCPLCENIPEKIQPLIKRGNVSDLAKLLNEHIAKHIVSLSLISLPWIDGEDADAKGKSIKFGESFKRLLNLGSKPQMPSQPSGIDRLSVDYPSLSVTCSRTPSETSETSTAEVPLDSMSMWEIGPLHSDPRLDTIWETLLELKLTEDDHDPILMALRQQQLSPMRLLKLDDHETLGLESFSGCRIPQYAILSHTVVAAQASVEEDLTVPFSLPGVHEAEQFVGRKEELIKIKEAFEGDLSQRTVVLLHGLGGIGKTQLAVTFVKEHKDTYSAIFWLNGKNEDTLKQSFAIIAKRLHDEYPSSALLRTAAKSQDIDQTVAAIKQWLSARGNHRWMLVFDNIDNPKLPGIEDPQAYDIRSYFPETHHGSILITTRSSDLKIGKAVSVRKLLDIQESIAILTSTSGRVNLNQGIYVLELA